MRRALRTALTTRLTWPAGSGVGTRNAGDGGKGAAASSGRNAVIAQRMSDGEGDREGMHEAAGEAGRRGGKREA